MSDLISNPNCLSKLEVLLLAQKHNALDEYEEVELAVGKNYRIRLLFRLWEDYKEFVIDLGIPTPGVQTDPNTKLYFRWVGVPLDASED